jgi:pimeloyl-ACP methyl ester carboxylesterase
MVLAAAALGHVAGCVGIYIPNPDYPATDQVVKDDWARMKSDPKPLKRPLVILGGYHAPSWSAQGFADRLRSITDPDGDVLVISYPFGFNIDTLAREAVRRVEARWPSTDPDRTTEVDVVGISMGGLVARVAALPPDSSARAAAKSLNINRLFTVGTPHRGAKLADTIAIDTAARCMRSGCDFLEGLNAALPDATYELICYARLHDTWVGATNSAPPGLDPIWTGGTRFFSHQTITLDRRILADIAHRLRDEPPLAAHGSHPPRD